MSQVALVTGVSSGIGRAVAGGLAAAGFRVFGTLRDPRATAPDAVQGVAMDVAQDASVEQGVAQVLQAAGRIDVLVNNAGGSLIGAIEECSLAQAKKLFDTNFFGALRVTRAVLPAMRALRHGRVVNISSVVGFVPAPFMGVYAASKHALEGYSESLDHEVRPLGIRVVLIEPAFTRTSIARNTASADRPLPVYAAARENLRARVEKLLAEGAGPETVAHTVLEAVHADEPKLRYPVGGDARMLGYLRRLMPPRVFDRSLRRQFRLDPPR